MQKSKAKKKVYSNIMEWVRPQTWVRHYHSLFFFSGRCSLVALSPRCQAVGRKEGLATKPHCKLDGLRQNTRKVTEWGGRIPPRLTTAELHCFFPYWSYCQIKSTVWVFCLFACCPIPAWSKPRTLLSSVWHSICPAMGCPFSIKR